MLRRVRVGRSRAEHGGGEVRVVERVGEELGLEAEARVAPVARPAAAGDAVEEVARVDLGSTRVIQRRFNVSVPRARVPEQASTLRDRSER